MVTKDQLANAFGDFTWFWDDKWFIETDLGNFIWSDPDYNGNNTMVPFDGNLADFHKKFGIDYGRDKGKHLISQYCGDKFTLLPK